MSKIEELRKQILKILHQEGTPYSIALGAAIGIFWNFIPSLGIGPLLCILLAKLLKARAVIAVTINIATGFFIPLFYSLNVITGRILTGFSVNIQEIEGELGQTKDMVVQNIDAVIDKPVRFFSLDNIQSLSADFIIGTIVNSFLFAFIVYLIMWVVLTKRKKYKVQVDKIEVEENEI